MPEIQSYGEVEADGSVVNPFRSEDFQVTKQGSHFVLAFDGDKSGAIIVATAKTQQNGDPAVVAIVERTASSTFRVTVVQAGNAIPRNDRGFWFMAISPS